MKSISVKQPWAYLLCAGIKDIENRTWELPEKYKGEWILIHASALKDANYFRRLPSYIDKGILLDLKEARDRVLYSCIVGAVKFSHSEIGHGSIWAENSVGWKPIHNWVVQDAILFEKPIRNVKGKLSFWEFDLPEEYKKLLIY